MNLFYDPLTVILGMFVLTIVTLAISVTIGWIPDAQGVVLVVAMALFTMFQIKRVSK